MIILKSFLLTKNPSLFPVNWFPILEKGNQFPPAPPAQPDVTSPTRRRHLIRSLSGRAHQLSLSQAFLSAASQDPSHDLSFS